MSEAALLRRVIDNLPELMARVRNVEVRECNGSSICGYPFDCSKAPADGDVWQFDSQSGTWGHVEYAYDLVAESVTISGGVATIADPYAGLMTVDTQGAAATDDLDTINTPRLGRILVIRTTNDARDVTLKDGTGNLSLAGDFTLDDTDDFIMLVGHGGAKWGEVSRSDNS